MPGAGASRPLAIPGAHGKPDPLGRTDTAKQQRMGAKQPASGPANHARHHVSRKTQS